MLFGLHKHYKNRNTCKTNGKTAKRAKETTKTTKRYPNPINKLKTNIKYTPRPLTSIASRRALYKWGSLTSTCLYSLAWWRQMPARHAVILEAGPAMMSCESLLRPNPSRHRARVKAIEVRGQGRRYMWRFSVLYLC